MTELLKVNDTAGSEVAVVRRVDNVPFVYEIKEFKAQGINIFATPETNTAGKNRTRIVQFYDADLNKKFENHCNKLRDVVSNRNWAAGMGILPNIPLASGFFILLNKGQLELDLLIIMAVLMALSALYCAVKINKIKFLKLEYSHLINENNKAKKNFKVSGIVSNYLQNFVKTNCKNNKNMLLLDAVRDKFEAEQSDEELTSWMRTVELILAKDEKFPIDLIPVESAEAVDVLFRMPDKIIERSIEHEALALEDARSVAERLKYDSVAVHTGALRYLGVEGKNG